MAAPLLLQQEAHRHQDEIKHLRQGAAGGGGRPAPLPFLLEGHSFHVLTDHKPLVFALHRARDAWSARQGRHLAYVAEFTSDLRHVAGADNVVADCLSRPPEELSLSRSTQVAGVKVPSGSLATPETRDGSSRPLQQQQWSLLPSRGPSGGESWHVSS